MAQDIFQIAKFLNITPGSPCLQLRDEDKEILNNIDSRGAYEIARLLANRMTQTEGEHLMKLIDATWDAICLGKVSQPTAHHPDQLKLLFKESPNGGLAQKRIIELLTEKDSLD